MTVLDPVAAPPTSGRARRRGRATRRALLVAGWLLLLVPVVAAVAGPLLAGWLGLDTAPGGVPLRPAGPGHPLGTDVLGRDLCAVVLHGGSTVLGMTLAALALAYAIALPVGLLAAGAGRLGEGLVVGLFDVVLALPSLLVLMVLAATGRSGIGWLVVAVALVQLPYVVRLVRAASAAPACQAALEVMTMIGEPWWRVRLIETGRLVLPPVLVDAATRISSIVGLLASANFLGVGLDRTVVDWAVTVDQNMPALFLRPAAVLVPVALLVALCAGTNLLVDELLERRG